MVIKYVGGTATLNEDFELFGDAASVTAEGDLFTVTAAPFPGQSYPALRIVLSSRSDDVRDDGETIIFRLVDGPGYTVEGPTDFTVTIRE